MRCCLSVLGTKAYIIHLNFLTQSKQGELKLLQVVLIYIQIYYCNKRNKS